jgi:uncharacterized protein YegJ (DUF2314 family)
MGLFSKLFGKKKEEDKTIFYAEQDKKMEEATLYAQKNFKYFWRELYWEYKRIIPAHDFAMVKIPFEQKISGQNEPVVEHMWINNINFDGEFITGELVNAPNELTNVSKGDTITKTVNEIGDWMFSIVGKTYGGFTIHVMRSGMKPIEREEHDNAWGLNFGNHDDIQLVFEQKKAPENLIEHPMSKNMGEEMRTFFTEHPDELTQDDENGLSFLHREAIAGNKTGIEILLELGVDKMKQSKKGKTALEYAKLMGWAHLVEILE